MGMLDGEFRKMVLLALVRSDETRAELTLAFRASGTEVVFADDAGDCLRKLKEQSPLDIVLIEETGAVASAIGLIREINRQSLSVPLFLLSASAEPGFDEVFLEGADAIFVRPLSASDLRNFVLRSYVAQQGHARRSFERSRILRAKITFAPAGAEISTGSSGFAMDVSKGGMFVGTMNALPEVGETIRFKMRFEQKDVEFEGEAEVRWLRKELEYGKPRGFGVRFINFAYPLSQGLLKIINS